MTESWVGARLLPVNLRDETLFIYEVFIDF